MPAPLGRHGSFKAKILGGENVKNKFVKILVVVLSVMILFIASCVSAFALDEKYSEVDFFKADFIKQCLSNDETFKEYSSQSKYYFVSCSIGGSDDFPRYFITVCFFDDNKFSKDGSGRYFYTRNCMISYEYFSSVNTYVTTDILPNSVSSYISSTNDIVYSTVDLVNSKDNSVFFQRPLTLLERLLNQVPTGVGEKIITDLATLTICGVACLALLIGLALLPKVLYKFL